MGCTVSTKDLCKVQVSHVSFPHTHNPEITGRSSFTLSVDMCRFRIAYVSATILFQTLGAGKTFVMFLIMWLECNNVCEN